MDVVVNGRRTDLKDGATVAELISSLGFEDRQVVVEHNGEPVERARFTSVVLSPDDVIEVVRPVAGG